MTTILKKSEKPKPLVLLILDGLGVASPGKGNAVTLANTKNLNSLWPKYPHCYLQASGNYVGLPKGVQGNSEVGHMSLGSGRIIFQEIARIDHEIENGGFFENKTLLAATEHVKKTGGKIHFMGLLSDGQVHSSDEHLFACLKFCKQQGLQGNVFVHAFTDGRDTPPESAKDFFNKLDETMGELKTGKLASIIGRYYAMDRDERWERTQEAYDLITQGKGREVQGWEEALEKSYKDEIQDEFIRAQVIVENGSPVATVDPGDVLIYFNYRADRAIQLSKAFEDENFTDFNTKKLKDFFFAGFSNYQKGIPMNRAQEDWVEHGGEKGLVNELFQEEIKQEKRFPEKQVFPPEDIKDSLGSVIAGSGLSQLRLTESEKFPHVTYFFNCRKKYPFDREDQVEVPSPKDVKTYDLKPEMSTNEITEKLINAVNENKYDFIIVNFALTDMVAHTGNLDATIKAVETADQNIDRIVKTVLPRGGEVIITADHGNAEEVVNIQTGEVDTQHSINPVPFVYVSGRDFVQKELTMGMLADIAPTILTSLKIDIPEEMTGRNLVS